MSAPFSADTLAALRELIGQIFVAFAIANAGVWTATRWCAAMPGYQPQIGEAWFIFSEGANVTKSPTKAREGGLRLVTKYGVIV